MAKYITIMFILGISIHLLDAKELPNKPLNNFEIAISAYQQKDYFKAAELFEKVCQEGNLNGCSNLGYLHDQGYGVRQNYEKAVELYTKACDGKIGLACFNLGAMYVDESNSLESSSLARYNKALEFMGRGCDYKNSHSCETYSLLNKVFSNSKVKEKVKESAKKYAEIFTIEHSIFLAQLPDRPKRKDPGVTAKDLTHGDDPLYKSEQQYNWLKSREIILQ